MMRRDGTRRPGYLEFGSSTAVATNVSYRLGKLRERGLLSGVWLDCGCADGGYSTAIAECGAQSVVGIDPEEERVSRAQLGRGRDRAIVNFCRGSAEDLPFCDAAFDGVFLNEVLEHVADECAALFEIRRVLRSGGHLAVLSPNRWFPFEGHGMRVNGIAVPVPVPFLPWLPSKLAMRFMCARNYWPGELRDIVHRAAFQIVLTTSILPVFEMYKWLPAPIINWYRRVVPTLERTPVIRKFGVSTFVLARKP